MDWRKLDWPAIGVVLAFHSVLGGGFLFLNGQIQASEARVTNHINNVETALKTDLGNRINEVKVDLGNRIDEVKTDLGNRINEVKTDLGGRIDEVKVDLKAHEKQYAERDREVAATLGGLMTAVTNQIPTKEET